MAADYWHSTQCAQWILAKDQVEGSNKRDRQYLSFDELYRLKIHFINLIQNVGVGMKMRQRAISTAIVYFKRFYVKNSFIDCEPRLIATTCLYLASKVEECTTQAKKFVLKMREYDSTFLYDMNHILECEFYLLEELEFCLIVFHPYRSLQSFLADEFSCEIGEIKSRSGSIPRNGNTDNESFPKPIDKDVAETAWAVLNDSYRTDGCLLYPPHIISLASIFVAMTLQGKEARTWFTDLNVEMKDIWEVSQKILDMYEQWSSLDFSISAINQIRAKLEPVKSAPPKHR